MSRQTISETEYATLWYYPEDKIVHHQFHKFIHSDEFRKMLMNGVDVFKQYGADKWLSDDRLNGAMTAEDIQWGQDVWTPAVFAAGWKYWAIMMPDKVVGKMSMRRLIDQYSEMGVTVDIFDDTDEALKWLRSV